LEERLINLGVVPDAAAIDFSTEPPGSWLLGHVPWTEAEHSIAAIGADADTAAALGLERGTACLRLERWTWYDAGDTSAPERITWVRQTFPGTAFILSAHFSARGGSAVGI
jgi:GntR family histidine utilization transcriptional repressor